jgi:hypothetical protein
MAVARPPRVKPTRRDGASAHTLDRERNQQSSSSKPSKRKNCARAPRQRRPPCRPTPDCMPSQTTMPRPRQQLVSTLARGTPGRGAHTHKPAAAPRVRLPSCMHGRTPPEPHGYSTHLPTKVLRLVGHRERAWREACACVRDKQRARHNNRRPRGGVPRGVCDACSGLVLQMGLPATRRVVCRRHRACACSHTSRASHTLAGRIQSRPRDSWLFKNAGVSRTVDARGRGLRCKRLCRHTATLALPLWRVCERAFAPDHTDPRGAVAQVTASPTR